MREINHEIVAGFFFVQVPIAFIIAVHQKTTLTLFGLVLCDNDQVIQKVDEQPTVLRSHHNFPRSIKSCSG